MLKERKSGILMPLFSIPSPFGIGDFGPETRTFCDFLAHSGQSIWQILPLSITEKAWGNSPYSSMSAYAGNPLFISPQKLFEDDLIRRESLDHIPAFEKNRVDYGLVEKYKKSILREAHHRATAKGFPGSYYTFCSRNSYWLEDFSLFKALKEYLKEKPWYEWPKDIRDRDPGSLSKAETQLKKERDFLKFEQFLFFSQWSELHAYCKGLKINIMGDMPIYVTLDSPDVWANRRYFQLDESGHPLAVAGVPPDYFSDDGQLWGNPLYNWNELENSGFSWWYERVGHAARIYDLLRIDHFRGFLSYWSIPKDEKTAVGGRWEKGPSARFLEGLTEQFQDLVLIAENLGVITPDVDRAMKKLGLPGMLVLQFAFDGDMKNNRYIPHNHTPDNIVYTGTHDNNTTTGWFMEEASKKQIENLNGYIGHMTDASNVSWQMIRMAMGSVARICIIPMQDLLELESWARTNRPSMHLGNWEWRAAPSYLEGQITDRLYGMTSLFGRLNA